MNWPLVWALLLVPLAALQVWAITHHRPAMLSRQVWAGMRSPWFRVPFFAFGGWLTWHWVIEFLWVRSLRGSVVDDLGVVLLFAVIGWVAEPSGPDRRDRP